MSETERVVVDTALYTGIRITCILGAFALFGISYWKLYNFIGSINDKWEDIKPQLTPILLYIGLGTVLAFIAAYLLYRDDPSHLTYFMLAVLCLNVGMSLSTFCGIIIAKSF
jgi:hypothetical protein